MKTRQMGKILNIPWIFMEIKRDSDLQKLIDRKQNSLVKIITGVRRGGISYLLFPLFYDHLIHERIQDDHIIQIALP